MLASDNVADPDMATIKSALALVNNPNRLDKPYHIVAEIQHEENLEAAHLVSESEVRWIMASDVMSRIMVQTARQSGLSQIFVELLDFDGDEIYFKPAEELVGKTYLTAQHAFVNSTVIGVFRKSEVLLNQKPTSKILSGDQLILIAPDDSEIRLEEEISWDAKAISTTKPATAKPDKTLILGTNANLDVIISELGEYVAPKSNLNVVSKNQAGGASKVGKLNVKYTQGDPTSRKVLESLDISSYDHIMVLADRDLGDQEADAHTLITLLQLRDMAKELGKSFNIVSEMLDDKNRKLAERTEADDFIVSDQLIGLMMSQVSENGDLEDVFRYLFSSDGSEISLQPAAWYVKPGVEVNMHALIEAAAKRGETAIGYRVKSEQTVSEKRFGIYLNPNKDANFKLVQGDRVIVLAEG